MEIINNKLGIAKCSINELTLEQANAFGEIYNLVMRYDHKTNLIVLIEEKELYNFALKLTTKFLNIN